MLVRSPFGEPREIVEDLVAIGVEDMRAVLVDANAVLVDVIISVPTDVIALVYDQDALARVGELARAHAAGETGAYYEVVIGHERAFALRCGTFRALLALAFAAGLRPEA